MTCLRTIGISTKLFRRLERFAHARDLTVADIIEPALQAGLESDFEVVGPQPDSVKPHDPSLDRPRATVHKSRYRVALKRTLTDRRRELRERRHADDPYTLAAHS